MSCSQHVISFVMSITKKYLNTCSSILFLSRVVTILKYLLMIWLLVPRPGIFYVQVALYHAEFKTVKKLLLLFWKTGTLVFHLLTQHIFCTWILMDLNLNKEIECYDSTRNTVPLCWWFFLRFIWRELHFVVVSLPSWYKTVMVSNVEKAF